MTPNATRITTTRVLSSLPTMSPESSPSPERLVIDLDNTEEMNLRLAIANIPTVPALINNKKPVSIHFFLK